MSIKSLFENIANAIKNVYGTTDTLTPAEMPQAITNFNSIFQTKNLSAPISGQATVEGCLSSLSSDLSEIGYTFHSRRLSNIPANAEVTSQVSDIYTSGGFIISVNPVSTKLPDSSSTGEPYGFNLAITHYGYDTTRKFCVAWADANSTVHTIVPSTVDILYALPMS